MARVIVEFTRVIKDAVEQGRAEIEVDNYEDELEIEQALNEERFNRFLVNHKQYINYEWRWKVKEILDNEAA